MDLRNAIDALYFGSGPMADMPEQSRSQIRRPAIWPDGTVVRIMVSAEAGEPTRAHRAGLCGRLRGIVGGAIRATTEIVADDMQTMAI